jgi:3-hydroxyisobutyrate dehydrogenase-like beta-hydroxyacid dehydrogenase
MADRTGADRIGFIGLGTMGLPMATNLAKGGVPLAVHDASREAVAAAARLPGAVAPGSAAAVAAQATVVFTCLPNDAIVREVYLGQRGIATAARAGLVTCDCSTVSPEATLAVHAALRTAAWITSIRRCWARSPRRWRGRSSSSWAAPRSASR